MPTPPASDSDAPDDGTAPNDRTALEPIRVLRMRNTDALARLLDDIREDDDCRGRAAVIAPAADAPADGETEELPPVPGLADRPRLGPGQRRAAVVIAVAAAAVVGFACALLVPGATGAAPTAPSASASTDPASATPTSAAPSATAGAGVLADPGFESGGLSSWNCAGNPGSIVSSPVHTGAKALQGKVSSSDTGQCDQTVAVRPNTAYSLTGWVRGSNVYLGVTGGPATWVTSPARFSPLTVSFTTGASQTSATVYVHGWYAQGAFYADDIALNGPGGGHT
ncbi:Carbohydrate binding domain-containing protein [Streptomyces sp. Ag109_O5-10]|nr:Carbohydrate binding domain-containing protein [Streptomyces sp. Ag109_O5-10]